MTEAQAIVSQKRRFSMVWIIPIIAMLLGGWMAVHNYQNRGPLVTIEFVSAEGIEADQTHIKALSVDIGLVKSVTLNKQRNGVIRHRPESRNRAATWLRRDSQFWVVRPRIAASGISGLNTLLSGAYIELSPGNGATGQRQFIGLNEPPLTPANTPGTSCNTGQQWAKSSQCRRASPLSWIQGRPGGEDTNLTLTNDRSAPRCSSTPPMTI